MAVNVKRKKNMTPEQLKEMSQIKWRHCINLAPGITTPGVARNNIAENMTERFGLPEDLTGKRVLDIGTFDGVFAFEVEKRGGIVKAIDIAQPDTPADQLL